jgi:hypothetical protein
LQQQQQHAARSVFGRLLAVAADTYIGLRSLLEGCHQFSHLDRLIISYPGDRAADRVVCSPTMKRYPTDRLQRESQRERVREREKERDRDRERTWWSDRTDG